MSSHEAISMFLLLAVTGAYQQTSPSFSLALSAQNASVKRGQPIYIKISMTNVSHHNVDCTKLPSNGLDRAFQYDIRDANRIETPKLVKPHPEIGDTFNVWPCILRPGETSEAAGGVISQVYDMRSSGIYSIQVSRSDPEDNGKSVLSNKLAITVEP
jgi:hypothetical protein